MIPLVPPLLNNQRIRGVRFRLDAKKCLVGLSSAQHIQQSNALAPLSSTQQTTEALNAA